jgi:hypothetical protein
MSTGHGRTTRAAAVEPPHECPGGCGREVPHNKLACPDCWWLLPIDMRKAITGARGRNRLQLVGEAVGWYREHVVDGHLVPRAGEPEITYTLDESWRPRGA